MMNGILHALAIAYPSPIPYMVVLVICCILLMVLAAKFPTLRNLHKKRTLLTYIITTLVFGLLIFQIYETALGPALVQCRIEPSGEYTVGTVNQFNVTATSFGRRTADVYLVLNSVNASLQTQNQPDYIQVNGTTLKVPFSLQTLRETESKTVLFTIDENVASFSINMEIDRQSGGSVGSINWMNGMNCYWNSTLNNYSIIDFSMAPV